MWNKPVQSFIGCEASFDEASLVLLGAPFDGTTSFRPGARFGPRAIRAESYGIETYSPYQDRDLEDMAVFDAGDPDLPFGNPARVLDLIAAQVEQVIAAGKRPVLLGGEHLVTLGAVRPMVKAHPGLRVLHFDAHADLRDDYLGEKLSHATVLRRVWELVGDGRIHQFGIRSGERTEFEFARQHTALHPFDLSGVEKAVTAIGGAPVYLTIDLDVLDPSIFPGTGTPEAGGVSFAALLDALLALHPLNIVGCDLVELAPSLDASGVSTAVACKLLRELLLMLGA